MAKSKAVLAEEAKLENRRTAVRAARQTKLDGVFGEGRTWKIVGEIEDPGTPHFTTFLGHKGRTGVVLAQVDGPAPTTPAVPHTTEEIDVKNLMVGPGLLKVAQNEFDGVIVES